MIINLSKNKIMARNPVAAVSFTARGRGMIGHDFSDFDAMIFNRCNCIHTMLMSIKIDVLFLNNDNCICDFRKKLVPWKPIVRCSDAVAVIELPEGVIERTGTERGDLLDMNAELTEEVKTKLKEQLLPTPEAAIPMKEQVNG